MIKPPPDHFEGTISDFVQTFVVPNLPPPSRLLAWMDAVLAHHDADDPILLVRGPRKGELARREGLRVAHGDNSPGIWCFIRAMQGDFDPEGLSEAIEEGRVPVLAALKGKDKRDWEWNYAKKALSKRDSSQLWSLKLKHCHILPVKAAPNVTAHQRAIRNICPANHFLFPNGHGGTRFRTERIDWTEAAPNDLGESPRVIGWVSHALRQHLGVDAPHYERFYLQAGGTLPSHPPPDARIRIVRVDAEMSSTPDSTESDRPGVLQKVLGAFTGLWAPTPSDTKLESAEQCADQAPPRSNGGTSRRWTLNATHGYYVKTNERQDLLDLTLCFKDSKGSKTNVGRFCLDLPWLAERGVVTRRGDVFDIKILRQSGGSYLLSVRSSDCLPLDRFRVE